MLPFDMDSVYQFILGMALAIARLLPCMIIVPAFCFKHIKGPLRYGVVTALALIPGPSIGRTLIAHGEDWMGMTGLLLKESLLGMLLGLLLYAPFWMFSSVGALLDNQRGALSGGQINPALGPDVTPMGQLFQEATVMLLIVSGGFSLITQVIWDSYIIWPPTDWLPILDAAGLEVFLGQLNLTLQHMMLYSAPFIGLLLIVEAALAIISLYAQQLHVFTLAMPAKCFVGIGFLIIYLPTLQELVSGELRHLLDLKQVLGIFVKIPGAGS